ncbi:sensor histidine kinase [Nocardioides sp. ChNu-153]|uniref:sensor histidine kinase n=1 Tax=unclassified Nocardioides TaxID=2615069 RepID=UPI0024058D8F|nr:MULTISPECIES: sensor histidine kinase [unclassified Nocardioides]MDF9715915.1 sensor histidine kinase [Nocardioides sp. ChNu-99]MDN7122908.1 sensor histidine kinase [Nocardioides sp. ChNu-153]
MARGITRPAPVHFATGALTRVLGLVTIGVPAVVAGDTDGLVVVMAFAVIWAVAITLSATTRIPVLAALTAEAVAVSAACGFALDRTGLIHAAALAVVPFLGGLRKGVRGLVLVILVQVGTLLSVVAALVGTVDAGLLAQLVAGYVVALGLGLLGCFVRNAQASSEELTPYRDARVLLEQLLELSDVLDAGLDAPSIGARVISAFQDAVPATRVSLWVVVDGEIRPLVTGSLLEAPDHGSRTAADAPLDLTQVLSSGRPVVLGSRFAVRPVGVAGRAVLLEGECSPTLPTTRRSLEQQLQAAADGLRRLTAQLDTALIFGEVNLAATRNERRRLAREMHDGVAQDIASMGYLLDAVAAGDLPDDVRPQVELLRATISRVVSEVRASVTALRMDVDANQSLGEAISGLARRLSDSSGISIRCTVDERTARLRPEVEAELLRIAQEAMTNAVKHSEASEIDVECLVDAPRARIVVRDNGRGLGPRRADSHGLTIMRERATLVGASLTIDSSHLGTVVYVSLGSRRGAIRGAPEGALS